MMQVSLIALLVCVAALACVASANRVIEWKRRLDTCDSSDRAFVEGDTTRFIYAFNADKNVATDSDLAYHGPTNRGSKSVKLFSPPIDQQISLWEQTKPADTYTFDLLVHNSNKPLPFDSAVTGPKTTYWCNAFPLPNLNDSQYFIRYDPIVPPAVSSYMHHLLVYECPAVEQDLQLLSFEGHCYDTTGAHPIPDALHNCNGASVVAAWAVGGLPFLYPSYLGMPFGGAGGTRYVLIESHWNNPSGANFTIDQSGIRFYATRKPPIYEAGMLEFGQATNNLFTIPPAQPDYVYESWCPAQCSQYLLSPNNTGTVISPNGGIRVIASFLHAHTTGIKIQLHRITADGVEQVLIEDNSYDFNFQTTNLLTNPIDVFPGESLRVQCHYNTMSRSSVTTFGLSTQQEMCLTYSMYYPRLKNTKSACLYANFSLTTKPEKGNYAFCGNMLDDTQQLAVVGAQNILPTITQPYTPNTCTYNPPPNTATQGPKGILSPAPFNSSTFANHVALDPNNQLFLHYEINNVSKIIHFALEYPITQGWMGLGYGGNGGMAGSDINLGWIDNSGGNVFLTDRFASMEGKPALDSSNDLFDIIAYTSTTQNPPSPPKSGAISSAAVFSSLVATLIFAVAISLVYGWH